MIGPLNPSADSDPQKLHPLIAQLGPFKHSASHFGLVIIVIRKLALLHLMFEMFWNHIFGVAFS